MQAHSQTSATSGAPVLAIVVANGVVAVDAVEVRIPPEFDALAETAVRERHQDSEGGVVRDGAPLRHEGAVLAVMVKEARLHGRREQG